MVSNIITHILEAISAQQVYFNSLPYFDVERDELGLPLMFSSNSALSLKVVIKGSPYLLKCYFEHSDNRNLHYSALKEFNHNNPSKHLLPVEFFPNSLLLNMEQELYTDTLLCRWIDGETMHSAIHQSAYLGQIGELTSLKLRFVEAVIALRKLGFVSGDLKPQNIIIDNNSQNLIFIDYDAAWIPQHSYTHNKELGTYWYSHPQRTHSDWGAHTDNYPIVLIIATLFALEQCLYLFERHYNGERFLFSPEDIVDRCDTAYSELTHIWQYDIFKLSILKSLRNKTPYAYSLDELLRETLEYHKSTHIDSEAIVIDSQGELRRFMNSESLYGYCNSESKIIIRPNWSKASEFEGRYATVSCFGKSMIIDQNGQIVSPAFDCIIKIKENSAIVRTDEQTFEIELPTKPHR